MLKQLGLCSIMLLIFMYQGVCLAASSYQHHSGEYITCFNPGTQCSKMIVDAILNAKHFIQIQAEKIDSPIISNALMHASRNNVKVDVIVDQSQWRPKQFSYARFLLAHGAVVWVNHRINRMAQNIINIDNNIIITGSNFFDKNFNNNNSGVLFIKDKKVIDFYQQNWEENQMSASRVYLTVNGRAVDLTHDNNTKEIDSKTVMRTFLRYR